jgi:oxygen-independent coproporphyrinogen-3 oxidase
VPTLPVADRAPADGALPERALDEVGGRDFGVYVHVPFCATRCGYCDFNTYTPGEDGGDAHAAYVDAALAEMRLAASVLGGAAPAASSVFFGGGTPTLLSAGRLSRLLDGMRETFGVDDSAEVTVEANPESADAAKLRALRAAGFTRLSVGMQSAREHVLAALERRHTPGRVAAAVAAARQAGFEQVSVDLIYGAPGETDADWAASLEVALALGPDHVSAYALGVEPGTRLHARVRRGEVVPAGDDALARRYRIADSLLTGAGLRWYELSNWAGAPAARSRHNLGYWRSQTWWGIGPGAHSHAGGVRWWNVLHPRAYASRLSEGTSPAAGRETLTERERALERVMLELRLAEGLALDALDDDGVRAAEAHAAEGRLVLADGRAVLTLDGRLMADAVARDLSA